MALTRQVNIRFEENQFAYLGEIAEEYNMSIPDFIRFLVFEVFAPKLHMKAYSEMNNKMEDIFKRINLNYNLLAYLGSRLNVHEMDDFKELITYYKNKCGIVEN